MRLWPHGNVLSVMASFPLLSFAYNATWAYVPILGTLRERRPARVWALIAGSMSIITVNYCLITVYGYNMFCDATTPNILNALGENAAGPQKTLIGIAKVMLVVQLTLAMPMRFVVLRTCVFGDVALSVSRRVINAIVTVGAACGLACLPLPLETSIGIVSSIGASSIIYIFPAIIDLRLKLDGWVRLAISTISLAVGLIILVGGTLGNIIGVAVGS